MRFCDRPCEAEHLSLFDLRGLTRPLEQLVLEQDIVYVGGGSMRNMLAIWRAHELDGALVRAWERGVVLAGLSAGAMCWFHTGVTRSSGPPEAIAGLALLPGSLTVHADGEPERLPVWLHGVRSGEIPGGWALDDGVGLHFRGLSLERVVSSRAGACAQRVDAIAGELVRTRLEPELLGERACEPFVPVDDAVAEFRRLRHMRRQLGHG
jgi:peptidase E